MYNSPGTFDVLLLRVGGGGGDVVAEVDGGGELGVAAEGAVLADLHIIIVKNVSAKTAPVRRVCLTVTATTTNNNNNNAASLLLLLSKSPAGRSRAWRCSGTRWRRRGGWCRGRLCMRSGGAGAVAAAWC